MKPYDAKDVRPTVDELKEMVTSGMTSQDIAALVSQRAGATVSRQAADLWIKAAGIPRRRGQYKSRKKYIPWQLTTDDNYHPITRRLRDLDRLEEGDRLTASDKRLLDEFLATLREANRVVAYDRLTGYKIIPRDATLDADDDWVRRDTPRVTPKRRKAPLRAVAESAAERP